MNINLNLDAAELSFLLRAVYEKYSNPRTISKKCPRSPILFISLSLGLPSKLLIKKNIIQN
jgi:hypothetical protein